MMRRVVITHALRTPIGRFLGALKDQSAVDLGTIVVKTLLERSGIDPAQVGGLIFGNGRQAGGGPNPARQILVRSGIPETRTAHTVNMACASGLKSIALAVRDIQFGDADLMIAGGSESMSRLPYFLPRARDGYRLGDAPLVDGMYQDGFHCPLADQLMGATAENLAEEFQITREMQDQYAVLSQTRCEAARRAGVFDEEIVPVELATKSGSLRLEKDEHPRDGTTCESMMKLPAVFKKNGTVHAGNSSGITDGAAAVLIGAEDVAKSLGLPILAVIEGVDEAGVTPRRMGIGPVPSTEKLLKRCGLSLADFDLIELNEAFAAQVLACLQSWSIDAERVNVRGGSIALGHPIGATGARIVVTLVHALHQMNLSRGLATLCVSGGMGISMSLRRP